MRRTARGAVGPELDSPQLGRVLGPATGAAQLPVDALGRGEAGVCGADGRDERRGAALDVGGDGTDAEAKAARLDPGHPAALTVAGAGPVPDVGAVAHDSLTAAGAVGADDVDGSNP